MEDLIILEPDERFMKVSIEKRKKLLDQYCQTHDWYTYDHMANIIDKKFETGKLTPIEIALLKSNFTLLWDVETLKNDIKDLEKQLKVKQEKIDSLRSKKEGFKMHVRVNTGELFKNITSNKDISNADKGFILSCISLLSMEGNILKNPGTKEPIYTSDEMAKVLGMPKSTVVDRVNRLIELGLLEKTEKGIALDPKQKYFMKMIDVY
ncbi:MAG: MarR family transcriptional regulator [Acholeplasmataceae bacterium]|nr:MarR family transcriptional regulator [Acholeplasmataceae bacterium]